MATDYYQLRVQGLHQTEYNECVMHFQGTGLDVADYIQNAKDLVDSWMDSIQALWNNMLPESQTTLRLSAKKASAGGGGEYIFDLPIGDQVGTVGGGAASQQLCPVLTLIPPMGVKSPGKIFLPCIAEGQIAANVVNAAWKSNAAALMSPLLSGFTFSGATWQLAIRSRATNSFSIAADYSLSPTVGFQRKRQRSPL
jgi:hypothetical protein